MLLLYSVPEVAVFAIDIEENINGGGGGAK